MIIKGLKISANTRKVLFVADAVDAAYEYVEVNLLAGETRTPEHFLINPFGKVPTLTHNDQHLFESGAICRYLAAVQGSNLYPIGDHYRRSEVDQWLDFFSVHLGRWINAFVFEKVIKQRFNLGAPNEEKITEATQFIDAQSKSLNHHLAQKIDSGVAYLTGSYSIADIFAYAYIEYSQLAGLNLGTDCPHIQTWVDTIAAKDSIKTTQSTYPTTTAA